MERYGLTLGDYIETMNHDAEKMFRQGENHMAMKVIEYMKNEHPTWYEHFGEELIKAMEE